MKRILLFVVLIFVLEYNSFSQSGGTGSVVYPGSAYSPGLPVSPGSPDIEVYLLTCGPGQELYATWGHTALRVKDIMPVPISFITGEYSTSLPNISRGSSLRAVWNI